MESPKRTNDDETSPPELVDEVDLELGVCPAWLSCCRSCTTAASFPCMPLLHRGAEIIIYKTQSNYSEIIGVRERDYSVYFTTLISI
jgi:hypothetical protein